METKPGKEVRMKKLIFGLMIFGLSVPLLQASDYRAVKNIRLAIGDTVNTDLFAFGRNIDILGYLNGDLYAGGQRITIEGVVTDDVVVGGQDLFIRGKVGGGVIFFGRYIHIDGEIHGDVIAFCGQVSISSRAVIHGNLIVGTGELNLYGGSIGGYIKGGGGRIHLDGTVAGYVELEADHISFGPGYDAKEGTSLKLNKPLDQDAENVPADLEVEIRKRPLFFTRGFFYWSFFSMFLIGVVFTSLFKNFSRDYVTYAGTEQVKSLGMGLLFLVGIPVVIVILTALVLTIPIALILLAFYLIMLYLSTLFSALYLGDFVITQIKKNNGSNLLIASLFVGLLIAYLLPKMPYFGWLINLAIICFGFGSFVLYIWKLKQTNNQQTA